MTTKKKGGATSPKKPGKVRRFFAGATSKIKSVTKRSGKAVAAGAKKTGRGTKRVVTVAGRVIAFPVVIVGSLLWGLLKILWFLVSGLLQIVLHTAARLLSWLALAVQTVSVGFIVLAGLLGGAVVQDVATDTEEVVVQTTTFTGPAKSDEALANSVAMDYQKALAEGNKEKAGYLYGKEQAIRARVDGIDPVKAWAVVHKIVAAHDFPLRVRDVKRGFNAEAGILKSA